MAYNEKFATDIKQIIKLIQGGHLAGPEGAQARFETYIQEIQEIGPWDQSGWNVYWATRIEHFGVIFKNTSPAFFIQRIERALPTCQNEEVLEFIRAEIFFNTLSNEQNKLHAEGLVKKYPFNIEILKYVSAVYSRNEMYDEALYYFSKVFEAKKHVADGDIAFNTWYSYINYHTLGGKYDEAREILCRSEVESFKQDPVYNNILFLMESNIIDQKLIDKKINGIKDELVDIFKEEVQSERKKSLEIIGIFTAIIAFVLSTINYSKLFSFQESSISI